MELQRINIVQGEYHVSSAPDLSITTLLGSCVAACISDIAIVEAQHLVGAPVHDPMQRVLCVQNDER